jgi:hypothetical protein
LCRQLYRHGFCNLCRDHAPRDIDFGDRNHERAGEHAVRHSQPCMPRQSGGGVWLRAAKLLPQRRRRVSDASASTCRSLCDKRTAKVPVCPQLQAALRRSVDADARRYVQYRDARQPVSGE